jgi:hypothetical protein
VNRKDNKKLLVLVLSMYDYCGSGYLISRALRKAGFESYLIKRKQNTLNTPADYILEDRKKRKWVDGNNIIHIEYDHESLEELYSRADFILMKGDEPPQDYKLFALSLLDKATGIITGGSKFRRNNGLIPAVNRGKHKDISKYLQVDLRAALTPEMCYPGLYDGIYIPAATRFDAKNEFIQEKRWKKKIVIAHSPSNRHKKGTRKFLLACFYLRKMGYDFDIDLIEKVSQAEAIERKRKATINVDQFLVGFYGNSGIEAMRYGIPTACWISDDAYNWSGGIVDRKNCPVINTGSSVYSIAKSLEQYLQNPGLLQQLSKRTYQYCKDTHSIAAVGNRLGTEIRNIINEKRNPWQIRLANASWKNKFQTGDVLEVSKDICANDALNLVDWGQAELVENYEI